MSIIYAWEEGEGEEGGGGGGGGEEEEAIEGAMEDMEETTMMVTAEEVEGEEEEEEAEGEEEGEGEVATEGIDNQKETPGLPGCLQYCEMGQHNVQNGGRLGTGVTGNRSTQAVG